jgi:large subunit ribosomal protein L24
VTTTRTLGFTGAASVDANDPKTLVAWLIGRPGTGAQIKPWQARGEVTLGADRIAVERLSTEFERGTVEGRLAYVWSAPDRPARLDAELSAGELDIDALLAFGGGALSGLGLERPREVALALEIGRARFAGFEARQTSTRLKFDAGGIAIERLSVADFGNATIEAQGRIETTSSPGGTITLDLDARELAGVIALAERFATPLAGPLRQLAARQNNARLRATVSLQRAGSDDAAAKLDLAGRVGALRVRLAAGATARPEAFAVTDLRALDSTDIKLEGSLESDDGGVLLALIGLERLTADRRPARLSLVTSGSSSRELRVDGKLVAGAIDLGGKGALKRPHDQPATLALDEVSGTVGGSRVQGKLSVSFADSARVEGALESEAIDVPAVVAILAGMQPQAPGKAGAAAGSTAAWSSDPFVHSTSDLAGRIEIKASRATLSPIFSAQQFRGVARFGISQVVFEDVEAQMAGGRLSGRLALTGSPDGLTARGRLALSGADAATFGGSAVTGRLTLQAEVEGAGLSPAAFIGSLAGTGTVTLENAQLAGLNPRAFDAVIRAVDLGIPTDTNRIRDFVATALDNGNLPLTHAEGALTIAGGQARLRNVASRASGADLAIAANVDLADGSLDATLTLTGTPTVGAGIRPAVFVSLKGPFAGPKRSVDATALAGWLALRSVEQQSKRIEAMEKARREAEEAMEKARREAEAVKERARREAEAAAERARAASLPDSAAATPDEPEVAPAVPAPAPSAKPAKPAPAARETSTTTGVPAIMAPPQLPPPINITPAPRPRSEPRPAARAENPAPQTPQARPAPARTPAPPDPAPAAPRWPFDLFGSQR